MLPPHLNGAQLLYVIRRRMQLRPSETVFLLCGGRKMIGSLDTVSNLHALYRDPEDGFLYITYALENAFG